MESPFFNFISYLVPFTYVIHAQGTIIYGIAANVNVASNSLYVLQMFGILLIYPIIFSLLGYFVSKRREREMNYGSCNRTYVYNALKELKIEKRYLNSKGKLD
jgi:hypothetical protein